jgi:hypothetical protein
VLRSQPGTTVSPGFAICLRASFDATTGSITDVFNFNQKNDRKLILDPTFGTVDTETK